MTWFYTHLKPSFPRFAICHCEGLEGKETKLYWRPRMGEVMYMHFQRENPTSSP